MINDNVGKTFGALTIMNVCDERAKNGRLLYHVKCNLCGREHNKALSTIKRYNNYCSITCQAEQQQIEWEEKWLSGEISGTKENDNWGVAPKHVRTYLFKKYNNKCSLCGWGEINPFTGKIPLEVEHIDGNYKNNRPENVTLLCPNCHSLTQTYRGANRGHGRPKTWRLKNENNE